MITTSMEFSFFYKRTDREVLGLLREVYRFKNLGPRELRECLRKELPSLTMLISPEKRQFYLTVFYDYPPPEDLRFWRVIHHIMQDYWLAHDLRRWLHYLYGRYSPPPGSWFWHVWVSAPLFSTPWPPPHPGALPSEVAMQRYMERFVGKSFAEFFATKYGKTPPEEWEDVAGTVTRFLQNVILSN